MRGGLGRTLLTAFLLLTILPLTATSLFASNRIRKDAHREVTERLAAVLSFKASQLTGWLQDATTELERLASRLEARPGDASVYALALQQAPFVEEGSAFSGLVLVDDAWDRILYAPSSLLVGEPPSTWQALSQGLHVCLLAGSPGDGTGATEATIGPVPAGRQCRLLGVAEPVGQAWLVGFLRLEPVQALLADRTGLGATGRMHLVLPGGLHVLAGEIDTEFGARAARSASAEDGAPWFGLACLWNRRQPSLAEVVGEAPEAGSGSLAYVRDDGERMLGVYHWLPELQAVLLAAQTRQEVIAASEDVVALIIAVTLAAALLTAPIAALVARRITTPLVQLTVSASRMSKGQLSERVTVERRDEIGLLARAFNRMAAELEELYTGLETKVQDRTRQLAEATERARRHAIRLAISAEVARIVSSIRDLDELLTTVAQTIANAFSLSHVSIYLIDAEARWAIWQAGSVSTEPGPDRVPVGGPTLVGQVAADGQRRIAHSPAESEDRGGEGDADPAGCQLVVPLRLQDRVVGVLDLWSSRRTSLGESDQLVYQSLADQISIAIENARAYAAERETVVHLRELDRIQAQFLTNMSHALRMPLNSILGFSRILLKELEGPLTDVQRDDLTTIHQSGRQLLGLINDMLELSHLEIGTAPFSVAPVNLADIVDGVMATARALALNKPVRVYEEVPSDLPVLWTDGQRVRQVILALVSNAVKFTEEGTVRLRVVAGAGQVAVSVRDTGVGMSPEELTRLFSNRAPAPDEEDGVPGFGLAISKRVVEKLGGHIWVESEAGIGSTFTFTLPIGPVAPAADPE